MQKQKASPKTALVFGGSRGIGAAAVERLAQEGFNVAFTFASSTNKATALADAIAANGVGSLAIQADSADPTAIRRAVGEATARFGNLDAVVVNAGILRPGTVDAVSLEDLDQMLNVNVRGVFLSIQASVPHLNDGARIVTIGSNVALHTRTPGFSVYQLTKTAVAGMVKGVALDLASRGITVNNIQPGPTETDMTAGSKEVLAEMNPLKRIGHPSEIAGLIAYLVGADARYVTGASITIDGGFTL
ncbi:3-oxoacyl-[acyl-carrier protein] reductase [Paraburkholderia atlantica]|uniref:3-oxoacyl-[acyl-carrier protein] reductase n=1 Tax=Paraburkholderia atlantica TaxID=2654982 RepID=A0A6I1Q0J8_PARAM|nr:SDR family oxidoreductase [Paraburkholderia atlantica]MBB5417372.1 3-oxoacyl-[acyl-carrier protein] reductase [Paraburkholderia atlantica]MBB5426005.1 3-oxoacyl-[acyl-carrier protein] reductase [Paraburkholderia atlantica]MPW06682.1 SDR family oxidoreductase [Paraburkholderia atlantica]NUY32369.1 SDR family oxidoreductase [Paraburkholderia atlantica]